MVNNTDKKVFKVLIFLAGLLSFLVYTDSQKLDEAIIAGVVIFVVLAVMYKIIKWLVFSNFVRTVLSKVVIAVVSGVVASVVLSGIGVDSSMVVAGGGASVIMSLIAINA